MGQGHALVVVGDRVVVAEVLERVGPGYGVGPLDRSAGGA